MEPEDGGSRLAFNIRIPQRGLAQGTRGGGTGDMQMHFFCIFCIRLFLWPPTETCTILTGGGGGANAFFGHFFVSHSLQS